MGYDLDKLRRINPLSAQLDKYGIVVDKKGFAKCPFHDEKTASFKVFPDGTYHCFGCGAHGDVISFVMGMMNISFKEACCLLDGEISYSEQRRLQRQKRAAKRAADKRVSANAAYWDAFDEWKENEEHIKLFKPSSPEEKTNSLFLMALERRSRLEAKLDKAETAYRKEMK